MRTWFKDLLDFVYPDTCSGCNNPILSGEASLCISCQVDLPKALIKDFQENSVHRIFTGRCYFQRAAAMYVFQKGGILQNTLHEIKYRGNKEAAHLLGSFTGQYFQRHGFLEKIDCIIPIPLHPKKLKERGYNQSVELALGIKQAVPDLEVSETLLKRDVHNTSQTKKSRFNRWLNVEHIFALGENTCEFEGKHVLLFDDVVTTGATIEAAYNKLIQVRGIKVSFLALAVA